jgi:hypothetical protein
LQKENRRPLYFEQGYALIIGISHYSKVSKLSEVPLKDAIKLHDALRDAKICGYSDSQVRLLTDDEATADNIRDGLVWLAQHASQNATVFIYFSGHGWKIEKKGQEQYYLLACNSDLNDLQATAIAGDELTKLLNNIHIQRLVFCIDSCHAGGIGEIKGVNSVIKARALDQDYYEQLAQGTGRVIIASSRSDEESVAFRSRNHSLFTGYLLEALQGKASLPGDQLIHISDVFRYISKHMAKYNQHPIVQGKFEDFPIALAPLTLPAPEKEQKSVNLWRERLLKKVHKGWIEKIFEPSLQNGVYIHLEFSEVPEAIHDPWNSTVQDFKPPAHHIPSGTSITQIYNDAGGELLILGEPGAGKTTSLLKIAQYLLTIAQNDTSSPLPVVLHLSTWSRRKRPLAEWVIDELAHKYKIRRDIGRAWLEENKLILLLEGLDEIEQKSQALCINVINRFLEVYSSPMVVCCRYSEYTQSSTETQKFQFNKALLIHPLTDHQIDTYLTESTGNLDAVRNVLAKDPNIHEMAERPLMLRILTQAYEGASESTISQLAMAQSTKKRLTLIGEKYVHRMLTRRKVYHRYSETRTVQWLQWLAKTMEDYQFDVLFIPWLQPNWLTPLKQNVYRFISTLTSSLLHAVPLATLVAFSYSLLDPSQQAFFLFIIVFLSTCSLSVKDKFFKFDNIEALETISFRDIHLKHILIAALIFGLGFIFSYVLFGWLGIVCVSFLCTCYIGYIFFPVSVPGSKYPTEANDILIESIATSNHFSSEETKRLRVLVHDIQIGNAPEEKAQTIAEMLHRSFDPSKMNTPEARENFATIIREVLENSTEKDLDEFVEEASLKTGNEKKQIKGFISHLQARRIPEEEINDLIIHFFWKPIDISQIDEQKLIENDKKRLLSWIQKQKDYIEPDQGIRLSLRNGLFAAGFGFIIGMLLSVWLNAFLAILFHKPFWSPMIIVLLSIATTLSASLGEGNGLKVCIQHYTLRLCLWLSNAAPLRYTHFLNYATERVLLRKIGGGYIFDNQFLRDYFTELNNEKRRP